MASPKPPTNPFFLLTIFLSLLSLSSETQPATGRKPDSDLIRLSCVHARYPNLCINSLSAYAGSAQTPNGLAQAAVSVSLSRAQNVTIFLSRFLNAETVSKRERSTLRDCVEQLSDSIDELRKTLSELRHLRSGTFRWQMSNAETWVSAALTNDDTCADGFKSVNGSAKMAVRRKISNVARVTSNALYLVNRLASTRGSAAGDP
ncbi:plant invertase/pectin methylesterase inhibitor superfamily protein [Tasmannia lanceolata]|uniref:plant invertase/pectin methylesterase inhibitor superfamily protein n=1 Tax=Tasmannia lanceolata TaxID=3420 RepID=UPI0040639837